MVEKHVFDFLVDSLIDYVAKMKGLYNLTDEETVFMLDIVKFLFKTDKMLQVKSKKKSLREVVEEAVEELQKL